MRQDDVATIVEEVQDPELERRHAYPQLVNPATEVLGMEPTKTRTFFFEEIDRR